MCSRQSNLQGHCVVYFSCSHNALFLLLLTIINYVKCLLVEDVLSESSKQDLAAFLDKVNEIGDLVKDLNTSADSVQAAKAIEKADEYLKSSKRSSSTTGFNHTAINTHTTGTVHAPTTCTSHAHTTGNTETSTATPQEFCSSLEEDARIRAERRREKEAVSKEWKKKGGVAFKKGEVREALNCYTAALKETPWSTVLYTNRALCYNKLKLYEDAIKDCDAAIKIEPATLKAHVHKGKALAALGKHKQAIQCYREALSCDPQTGLKAEIQTELDTALAASTQ